MRLVGTKDVENFVRRDPAQGGSDGGGFSMALIWMVTQRSQDVGQEYVYVRCRGWPGKRSERIVFDNPGRRVREGISYASTSYQEFITPALRRASLAEIIWEENPFGWIFIQ